MLKVKGGVYLCSEARCTFHFFILYCTGLSNSLYQSSSEHHTVMHQHVLLFLCWFYSHFFSWVNHNSCKRFLRWFIDLYVKLPNARTNSVTLNYTKLLLKSTHNVISTSNRHILFVPWKSPWNWLLCKLWHCDVYPCETASQICMTWFCPSGIDWIVGYGLLLWCYVSDRLSRPYDNKHINTNHILLCEKTMSKACPNSQ